MPSIYRFSQPGREPITDVDSVEAVEGAIRAGGPGCYHVEEISSEPLPSGHTSRRWGLRSRDPIGWSPSTRIRDRTDDTVLRPHRRGRAGTLLRRPRGDRG
jgi:hypothetical protein